MNQIQTQNDTNLQAAQLDYILLDGSSSMTDKWWATIAALRGYADALAAQNIHSRGIIQVFDSSELNNIQRDCPIAEWGDLADLAAYWGSTPLYDAISLMARRLRDLDPTSCSIVIVTDGEENASRHTTADQARAMLDWCRAKGWMVTFLGADFNNNAQARLLGADASNSVGVQKALLGSAGKTLGQKRVHHARSGDEINFSEDERKNFGGYLTNGK